jgi:N-acetylglucosamine kinase-like BadF-type ATPase
MPEELYLGIDGGQSHTEAVISDGEGNLLGRGRGGPSGHAEQPGGLERVRRAVTESVEGALRSAGLGSIKETEFAFAHCAMTGDGDFKEEPFRALLRALHLRVGHDAPAALAGATGGEAGVVVIAGTGSVAHGEKQNGESLRIGGWGYIFGDEGGGFWTALQGMRRAMLAEDGLAEPTALGPLALEHFNSPDLMSLAMGVYGDRISRDLFASFAEKVHTAAAGGDRAAREVIREGAGYLAALSSAVARRLDLSERETRVACVGGVFRSDLVREEFARALGEQHPSARIIPVRFDPAIGALLLAYREAGRERTESLLTNLERGMAPVAGAEAALESLI